jgi:type IV pilus assembly protein PilX
MKNQNKLLVCPRALRRDDGVSLIIVMIMLVIIGLTSAAAIRNATYGERATNNIRMQNLAQQYAEAALRYCESQLTLADAARVNTLKNASVFNDTGAGIATAANFPAAGWHQGVTWIGVGGAATSRTTVPLLQLQSVNSAFTPTVRPQCVVERQRLPDNSEATVITSRGFSPDYTFNAITGVTTAGSVVWLQSTIRF